MPKIVPNPSVSPSTPSVSETTPISAPHDLEDLITKKMLGMNSLLTRQMSQMSNQLTSTHDSIVKEVAEIRVVIKDMKDDFGVMKMEFAALDERYPQDDMTTDDEIDPSILQNWLAECRAK